jgi:oligopeptide transport system permease protein
VSGTGGAGAALVAALLGLALLGDAIGGHRFDAQDPERALEAPGPEHWMGTDALGRDLLARLAEGARVSLVVAAGSTALAVAIGVLYGALAGYAGGRTDAWLMRGVDVAYALPDVLLIVLFTEVLSGALGGIPDLYRRAAALLLALALVGWVSVARLARALVLRAREELWVEAARALGVRPARILGRHILPNVMAPLLVIAMLRVPAAILAESTVSFIGLGVQPPFASWGVLAADGFQAMRSYPHLIAFPCGAILLALLGFHLLGDALRERLDPHGTRGSALAPRSGSVSLAPARDAGERS